MSATPLTSAPHAALMLPTLTAIHWTNVSIDTFV